MGASSRIGNRSERYGTIMAHGVRGRRAQERQLRAHVFNVVQKEKEVEASGWFQQSDRGGSVVFYSLIGVRVPSPRVYM